MKTLVLNGWILPWRLTKSGSVSSYTYYNTVKELVWLGIASTTNGKTVLLDNPLSSVFKRFFFEGFDFGLLSRKNIEILTLLLEPKTINELSVELDLSVSHTFNRVEKLGQFLGKEGNKYFVSKSNHLLFDFLSLVKKKNLQEYYWAKGEEKLLKLPLDFEFKGSPTAFSMFSEFGLQVNPSHNFVFMPRKELSLEEILSHAIKFSANANDLCLCMLFYLKNRPKFNVMEIEKNCEKLGVLETWFDMVSYLEDQPVRQEKMFLPRREFLEKAAIYSVRTIQRFQQNDINGIFTKAGEKLPEKTKVFLIGGNALIEHKAKNSTKDIDIVLLSNKEAIFFVRALKEQGYSEIKGKELQYGQLEASAMLEKNGFPRIDLFVKKICNALEFSKGMQERSKKTKEGRLELYLASLEDIFLLKSISSRDSDLVDCETILSRKALDWKTIYREITAQEKNLSGMKELILLEHFEALEKRLSIKIPITKKITNFCLEKGILFLAKKPVTVKEIMQKIGFPETTVRNKITQLVKNGRFKKTGEKPFMVVATGR